MCISPHAQGKREKETLVSFSLLILSFFLCIVRRFLLGKLHGHFATAGIRFCRCQPFRYGALLLFASQKMNFGVKKEVRSREPLPMDGKVENRKRFSKGFRPLRRASRLRACTAPETKFLDFSLSGSLEPLRLAAENPGHGFRTCSKPRDALSCKLTPRAFRIISRHQTAKNIRTNHHGIRSKVIQIRCFSGQ